MGKKNANQDLHCLFYLRTEEEKEEGKKKKEEKTLGWSENIPWIPRKKSSTIL